MSARESFAKVALGFLGSWTDWIDWEVIQAFFEMILNCFSPEPDPDPDPEKIRAALLDLSDFQRWSLLRRARRHCRRAGVPRQHLDGASEALVDAVLRAADSVDDKTLGDVCKGR